MAGTVALYIMVVFIWGSAWLALRFQLGVVPVEMSIAYRIALAALFMFAWSAARKVRLRFGPRDHAMMALQGALIFCCNFIFFYHAAAYLTTGLIAVICSTASMMIMLFNALLLRRLPAARVFYGALLGVVGIGLIFQPEVARFTPRPGAHAATGLLLSIGGTLCFAMGSVVSARNRRVGLPPRSNTAWAMFYGTLLLIALVSAGGNAFRFDPRWPYVLSLLYLVVIGTVVAFAGYFALLGRIEAERASYITVLFPIVALSLSTVFEGYHWSAAAVLGVALTLIGNVLVLHQPDRAFSAASRK